MSGSFDSRTISRMFPWRVCIFNILFNPKQCQPSVIHVTLEYLNHSSLIFRWIFVDIVCQWRKVCITLIRDISSFYKFQYVIVALELFFTSGNNCLSSFLVFLVRFVINSCETHIGCIVFFFECHLKTETVCLD